ncbi:MAG: alpha/beta hydrolase [Acidobacteria bacterium]|nr:alpha/beta hydrolase [Acidobacteriota bacterium]
MPYDGPVTRDVQIPSAPALLSGSLDIPANAGGIVLFAHGSGSSRHSPRNQYVARVIRQAGVGTLLFDLLTDREEAVDSRTAQLRFDIDLLARRLADATRWATKEPGVTGLSLGYFGSSTGAAAALVAAAELGIRIAAVVSRGGRPDLAATVLAHVASPTLLIVGALDSVVIEFNRQAYDRLRCEKEMKIVAGATHLFEEPGALEEVARLAALWFGRHLTAKDGSDELSRSN